MASRKLEIEIIGDDRSLQRALGRADKGFRGTIGQWAKGAVVFKGVAAASDLLTGALKAGVAEWRENQKEAALSRAVIKSTGGAAHVTAKHVQELANSLLKKTGIDDEAITSGENLLLTFTNIRNETGKGNDIFDQATKTVTDLSVALGQNFKQSAIQVGKALQDPITGLTALRRVGVSFTEAQKEQIKKLDESGHHLQAQKMILRELNKEFGGAAEAAGKTFPGQLNILREEFNNFAGDMVAKAIPVLQETIAWLRDHWPEISAAVKKAWADVKPALQGMFDVVRGFVEFMRKHWGTIGPIVKAWAQTLGSAFRTVGEILKTIAALLRGDWSGAWKHFGGVLSGVGDTIHNALRYEVLLLKAALEALGKIGEKVWDGIKSAAEKIVQPFKKVIAPIQAAVAGLRNEVATLAHAFGKVIDAIKWLMGKAGAIGHFFGSLGGLVGDSAKRVGDASGSVRRHGGNVATKSSAAAGQRFNIGRQLWDEIAMGQRLGLQVTSGYRPGAHTKHGTLSDHAHNPSRAVDMAGPATAMAQMFMSLIGRGEIRQAFYDPLGSIFGGNLSSYREGGHSDHIHIAEYAKGGIFNRPTLGIIGEAGPEAVVPLKGSGLGATYVFNFPHYVGNRRDLVDVLKTELDLHNGQNARRSRIGR